MKIAFHGGMCCGIKVIHGMGYGPNYTLPALGYSLVDGSSGDPDDPEDGYDQDACGQNVSSALNCYYLEAVAETAGERLDRYISFIKKWRPSGLIEICLAENADDPDEYSQIRGWDKPLKQRGFKKVVTFLNSNSDNEVTIYHLVYSKED